MFSPRLDIFQLPGIGNLSIVYILQGAAEQIDFLSLTPGGNEGKHHDDQCGPAIRD
jgi:hypothetical protein